MLIFPVGALHDQMEGRFFFFLKEDIYKKSQLDGVKSTQWEADRTENVKEKVVKNSNVAEIKEQRSHWSFN